MKICKYCGDEFFGKSYNGCCCKEEGKIRKSETNANYYAKNREVILANKYAGILDTCLRQFGENICFDAAILGQMPFDWNFSKKTIKIEGHDYRVIKSFAYIIYSNQKMKIIKL